MNLNHPAMAVCAALIVAACSIGKPIPEATTYIIEPEPPTPMAAARRAESMRMGDVRVAGSFSGNGLVYRMNDVQYVSDPYHAFIADPASMLGNGIASWLNRAGPFKAVAQPGSAQSSKSVPYVLEATVTELYGDFRPGVPAAAVMTIQFALVDTTKPSALTPYQSTIGRRVEIAQASPDALMRGYGKALTEILSQLSAELASLPASAAARGSDLSDARAPSASPRQDLNPQSPGS
ncbi:MAG TPA: ABC-type transport auxiliary lipoprotein family protein [Casimicrobiaceae bacterium]|nr:ABC-type transport auxiliary lipoprotein family protein [Casimicrobiaceae bacterium]